jgi:ADP-ribose pyrophosphatase YjhB (NUDIX family)
MKRFNIRVYGIYLSPENEILVSDETYDDHEFTKFPGGGLDWGEGTIDCLKREFIEEFNTEISVLSHFYTTDFFQVSAFHHNDQVISVYYLIEMDYENLKQTIFYSDSDEKLRLLSLDKFKKEDVTFPIDRHVAELILKKNR